MNTPSNTENAETTHRSKNVHAASKSGDQTEINTDNKGNDFYRTNNENSIDIQRKIKNMLEYRSDTFGNILNLSKHSFSLNTFRLLNKNLNFVPTSK